MTNNLKDALQSGINAIQRLYGLKEDPMDEVDDALKLMKGFLTSYEASLAPNPEIVLAYLEGKQIEYRDCIMSKWVSYDINFMSHPVLGDPKFVWRVRPKVLRYKRYLVKTLSPYNNVAPKEEYSVMTINEEQEVAKGTLSTLSIDVMDNFVRWIDEEWQEVEL